MEDADGLRAAVLDWARGDARVSAVIETGSRGRGLRVDPWSDLDLEIITPHWRELSADSAWVGRFGPVLLNVSFGVSAGEADASAPAGPSWPAPRLVVYRQGRKIDFTVAGEERLALMRRDGLDGLYARGYTVLFDRNGLTRELPAARPGLPAVSAPTEPEFTAVVEEFWFEASQVPIYLLRGELWVVKLRDWTMKTCLLRLFEWHALTDPDGRRDTWHIGQHLHEWLDPRLYARVAETFAGYPASDGWRALEASTALFAEAAATVADRLGFASPEPLTAAVRALIVTYRNSDSSRPQ